MKLITKDSWKRLSDSIHALASNVQQKSWSSYNHYTIEECVKSGRVSETILMVTDLENQIKEFKDKLLSCLSEEEQEKVT